MSTMGVLFTKRILGTPLSMSDKEGSVGPDETLERFIQGNKLTKSVCQTECGYLRPDAVRNTGQKSLFFPFLISMNLSGFRVMGDDDGTKKPFWCMS